MNVLLVWPNFERTNAAGVRGRAFAAALAAQGLDVTVAAPPDPDASEGNAGYAVHLLSLWRAPGDSPLAGRAPLRRLADEVRPDLVIASSPSVLTLLQASSVLRDRAPFVADVRDLGAQSLAATFGRKLRYRLLGAAEGRVLRRADAVLCVSSVQRDDLVAHHGVEASRVHVVPNGADLAAFRPVRATVKDVDVLFLGAMDDPGRRGEEVVDAFARVLRDRPRTRFRFLGWRTSAYAERLTARMREAGLAAAVDLAPPVPSSAAPAEIARARIGVVPLADAPVFRAAVGAKTYEYLAAGLPVVALGPRGDTELRRLLVGEECGLYSEDADGFALALLDLLADDERRARLSLRAAAVAERYDRAALVADAWQKVLRPLAEAER